MIDGEPEDALVLDESQVDEAAAPAEQENDGELVFHLDDDEHSEDETPLQKRLRNEIRERDRRYAESEREKAELRSQLARLTPQPVLELGPKPGSLEEFNWDEEARDKAIEDWTAKKLEVEAAERAKAAEIEKQNNIWKDEQKRFRGKASELGLSNFEQAEENVTATLGAPWKMGAIIKYADSPQKLTAALNRNPTVLSKLAGIEDAGLFMKTMLNLERTMGNAGRKGPPPPEAPTIQRGSAPLSAVSADKKLKELEAQADKTGDRTKLIDYKRSLKQKVNA